ncbi:MAG: ABC transporter permease [Fimbriimonadaceae bacterium]|nr:ABC transporter permease [Fimbriimonadaceae bacterium]
MSLLQRISRSPALGLVGLVVAWMAVFGLFALLRPETFPTAANLETLARQGTIVAMAAIGMTYVIVSGGLDLSVGSTVAFTTVVIAWLLDRGQGPWVALLGGIGAAVACGVCNGLLVTRLRVGPFVVTLGTLLVIRGLAKGLANEQKIDAPMTWLADVLATLGKEQRWMLVPIGVWTMLVFAALMALVLRRTRFGRHLVAIGSNENAARLCGVPVDRVKLSVYVVGGLFAGLAGLMQFSRLTVGDPTVAQGLELEVIAAVVIGGASLSGGQGTIAGALLGAAIMTTIRAGGSHMGWANWIQEIVTGAIIVLSVALDKMRRRG